MLEFLIAWFIALLPFQFALHPAEGVDLALVRVVVPALFLMWVAKSLSERRCVFPKPLPLFLFFAFLLWATSSLLWSENPSLALRKAIFLWSFAPLFLILFSALQAFIARNKVTSALVIGAALSAATAIVQFSLQFIVGVEKVFVFWLKVVLPLFLGPAFAEAVAEYPSLLVNIAGNTVMRASGLFPDPHIAAFYFGMSLPLAVALLWSQEAKKRPLWFSCVVIIFIADLLTFSRGGYTGLAFGALAFFGGLFWKASWRKWIPHIVSTMVILAVAIAISPVGERILSSFSQVDTSNSERVRLWKEAGELIMERPILGVGLGNYASTIKPSAEYREPLYAHNLYLDIALETGLVGLWLFLSLIYFGMRASWQKWRLEQSLFHLAAFSSLILFSVHAFFETPLFSVHVLPILLFLLAASVL